MQWPRGAVTPGDVQTQRFNPCANLRWGLQARCGVVVGNQGRHVGGHRWLAQPNYLALAATVPHLSRYSAQREVNQGYPLNQSYLGGRLFGLIRKKIQQWCSPDFFQHACRQRVSCFVVADANIESVDRIEMNGGEPFFPCAVPCSPIKHQASSFIQ
jgi:hypothetical protein